MPKLSDQDLAKVVTECRKVPAGTTAAISQLDDRLDKRACVRITNASGRTTLEIDVVAPDGSTRSADDIGLIAKSWLATVDATR